MSHTWNLLSDELQLALSRAALSRAVDIVGDQAEALAGEIELGILVDRGGADALRLLARIVRTAGEGAPMSAGHA